MRETQSGLPLEPVYRPAAPDATYAERLGDPGAFPYTRGPHATMYRGKPWTMRMFAGFGTPEDTNGRFKLLLEHGQTGLSTAFDMPTLMGFDPDHPKSRGEVGREGVSVASVADMERLFDGIPLDRVTTSMTINAPACVLLAYYIVVAERRGIPPEALGGTLQNDMLKEFIAQKEWICGLRPHLRIVRDMLVYCTAHMPRWNTISISGYHIREAGATAVQELAFTLADGLTYVALGRDAGLDVDVFAQRLSFFWDIHSDFFEEIAKLRAARRLWARLLRERFGSKNPRAQMLRAHAQTAGVSLACWAASSRCTRTASTRRSRCPPRTRPRWRCARSRSSPTNPAFRPSRTRWAAAGSSSRSPTAWRPRRCGSSRRSTRWAAWCGRSSLAGRSEKSPRQLTVFNTRSTPASGPSWA
jgi:methylmalonyl-CoA mutase N-terminal domain/subunit